MRCNLCKWKTDFKGSFSGQGCSFSFDFALFRFEKMRQVNNFWVATSPKIATRVNNFIYKVKTVLGLTSAKFN